MSTAPLSLLAIPGLPEIVPGMDLAALMLSALGRAGRELQGDDALLIGQKIISKAEGRFVDLDTVSVSARARELAGRCGKDPRLVEVILSESTQVVRCAPRVLIVRHRLGLVVANAAVDQSNVPGSASRVLLLPVNPDASAARLRASIRAVSGVAPAVIITDSFGRPWRQGVCGTAIGSAGLLTLQDLRGASDREGRPLQVTQVAIADALAAAAALLMGEAAEGTPLVHARGLPAAWRSEAADAARLQRPAHEDLFQ